MIEVQKKWLALYMLCAGELMIVLDTTIVNVALPSIRGSLGFSESALVWVVNAYMLTYGGFLLLGGRLGDLYGKGRILTAVLVLFSVGAVVNALAPSIEVLIAGRVLQGVAGGVFPLAFGIIRDTFPRDQIAGGLAMVSAVFGIGGGIGLPLSGLIVDRYGIAKELSLPMDGDEAHNEVLSSYRLGNGVLHNPVADRRTTEGVFHVADASALGAFGCMVANHPPDIVPIPLADVVGKTKTVPLDYDLVKTARAIGVALGD